MLHRALQQFLADVFWGDLDVLLLDLPPGTGDVAISVAQLIPGAEILVVTTPQQAAAEVAERAGSIALQTHQRVAGVIENMSWLELPDGTRQEIFGRWWRSGRRGLAHPLHRCRGLTARPDPARHHAADRCRRRHARGARPARLPCRRGPARDRSGSGLTGPRPGRTLPRPHPRRPLTPTSASCRSWVFRWPRRPSRTHVRMEPCSRRRPSPPSRSPQRRPPRGQLAPTRDSRAPHGPCP
jgi:hypothetical protein